MYSYQPVYNLTHMPSGGSPGPRITQLRSSGTLSSPQVPASAPAPTSAPKFCCSSCAQAAASSSSYRSRSPEWSSSNRSRSASPQSVSRPLRKVHFVDGGTTTEVPSRRASVRSRGDAAVASPSNSSSELRRSVSSGSRPRSEYSHGNGWEYVSSRGNGYKNEGEESYAPSRPAVVVDKASILEREGRSRRQRQEAGRSY